MRWILILGVAANGCAPMPPAGDSARQREEAEYKAQQKQRADDAARLKKANEEQSAESEARRDERRQREREREAEADETRRQEAENRKAEAERAKAEKDEAESRRLRLLGPDGRRKTLLACYAEYVPTGCTETVSKVLAAADTDAERDKLIALNEKTLQQEFDKSVKPPPGDIVCRDLTVSDACVCGSKLSGCCSGHGGVLGCVERRPLRPEEKARGPGGWGN
jgi:hypothetical protein